VPSPGSMPNALFREARRRLFGSRQALADAVNQLVSDAYRVSDNDIGKIERGQVTWPRQPRRDAYRQLLQVSTDGEIGFFDRRNAQQAQLGFSSAHQLPRLGASLVTSADLSIRHPTIPEPRGEIDPVLANEEAHPDVHAEHYGTALTRGLGIDHAPGGLSRPTSPSRGAWGDIWPDGRSDRGLVDILRRVDRLRRVVDPEKLNVVAARTDAMISEYETADTSAQTAELQRYRSWLEDQLESLGDPGQRQVVCAVACKVSGVLGYIAVGRSLFDLSRAYLLESFELARVTESADMSAWVRGMQSFCEYYSGNYVGALEYATDGIRYAGSGPQSVRLLSNGVARAMGKLGDIGGVHRAIEQALQSLDRQSQVPTTPSSIGLSGYNLAQVAGNAATAYLAADEPLKVAEFVEIALSGTAQSDSPWGRSLILIDYASAVLNSASCDPYESMTIAQDALAISAGRPISSVHLRALEFARKLRQRWGPLKGGDEFHEAIVQMGRSDV
jgi:hypothetical protein